MDTWDSLYGVKAAGCQACKAVDFSTEVKNVWSCTSTITLADIHATVRN
jgi:hypothetical protein